MNETHLSEESHSEKIQKFQFDGFYCCSSEFLTQKTALKSTEKTQKIAIDQVHMQLRLRVKAFRHLSGSFFKSKDMNN